MMQSRLLFMALFIASSMPLMTWAQATGNANGASQWVPAPEIGPDTQVYTRKDLSGIKRKDILVPGRANNEGVSGQSHLICELGPEGRFQQCVVLSETPEGYGFGKAHALRVLRDYQLKIPKGTEVPPGLWKQFLMRDQIDS